MKKIIDWIKATWAKFIALPWVVVIIKYWKKFWDITETEEFIYTFPAIVFALYWVFNKGFFTALVFVVWGIVYLRKCIK
jgi:hypothetical protein